MLIIISKKIHYEFSSVQFDLPEILADNVISWGKKSVNNSDLYTKEEKYGRENEIHVTVKYGLHTVDVRKVEKNIEGFGSFQIRLGSISRFVPTGKDYDVVKVEVDSDELSKLHQLLDDLPNSDEHSIYRAHCTVAYVKKGCCADLSGRTDLKGKTARVNKLTFSPHTGTKSEIKL